MSEIIKNAFVRVFKNPVLLIKGRTGYQTIIKNIVLNNKDIKTKSVDIYLLKNDEKVYLERNISIVPNTRLEVLNNKGIALTKLDRVFIESIKEVNIDAICNYIEKPNDLIDIDIIFTDQHGDNINDIVYNITDHPIELNRKIINFTKNDNFLALNPIYIDVKASEITVFKENDINIVSEYGYTESSDRFIINMFQSTYEELSNITNMSYIKVNIKDRFDFWRYRSVSSTTSGGSGVSYDYTSDWLEQDKEYTLIPGDYEIEFENLEDYDELNDFQFTALKNNFYDFEFENFNNQTTIGILKSDFIDNQDYLGIKWNITDIPETFNYEDVITDLDEDTYEVIVHKLDDYFEETTDSINTYKYHKTYYRINDEVVKKTIPPISHISPERIIININVIRNPVLSITIEPSGITDASWRIVYSFGVTDDWKTQDEVIQLGEGEYQLEFNDVDGYTKPGIYDFTIPISVKRKNIKGIYTENQTSLLTLNFVVPNRYLKYLSWCLVKPDNSDDDVFVSWNNLFKYEKTIQNGNYQLKIQEIAFDENNSREIFSFETGEIISNNIIIEGQTIDINLTTDTIIDIYPIPGVE
jgi:hypothetical protein